MFPESSNVTINDGTFTELYVDQSIHIHLCSVEAPQSEVEIGSRQPLAGTRRNEVDAAIRALISVLQDGEGDNEAQAATFSSERGRKQPQLYTHPKTNSSDTKEKARKLMTSEFLAALDYGAAFLGSLLRRGLGRRLIFEPAWSLGQTQISLFLTSDQVPVDVDGVNVNKPLVWQVLNIGGATREFVVNIPIVPGTGNVKIGYATIDEIDSSVTVVQCRTAEKAPARLISEDAWEHEGEPAKDLKVPRPKLTATNKNDHSVRIALGTYDDEKAKVQPLLLVELPGGGVYEAPEDLYLHAFQSNGYSSGQYGKTLFKDVVGGRLTPEEGFKLSKLNQLTSWYIRADRDGKLKLETGRNSRKDVKAYRHECKIGKDAIAKV